MVPFMASAALYWTDSSFFANKFIERLVMVYIAKINMGPQNTFLIVNNDILGSKCLSYLIIEIPLSTLCKAVSICILKFAILSRYISRYIWCEALPNDMSLKMYLDELSHIFFLRILLVAQVW